jgi:hypothetical protein
MDSSFNNLFKQLNESGYGALANEILHIYQYECSPTHTAKLYTAASENTPITVYLRLFINAYNYMSGVFKHHAGHFVVSEFQRGLSDRCTHEFHFKVLNPYSLEQWVNIFFEFSNGYVKYGMDVFSMGLNSSLYRGGMRPIFTLSNVGNPDEVIQKTIEYLTPGNVPQMHHGSSPVERQYVKRGRSDDDPDVEDMGRRVKSMYGNRQ